MQSADVDRIGTVKGLYDVSLRETNHGKLWPCGHERSPENTQRIGSAGVRCRQCRQAITRASYKRCAANDDPELKRLERRVAYLPYQIQSTREKLARLEAEAVEPGLRDLVEGAA